MSTTRFLVFEPKNALGNPAIVEVFTSLDEARAAFNSYIDNGTANIEVGQYILEITSTDTELNAFVENIDEHFANNFDSENVSVLETFGADESLWDDGALNYADEEFDSGDETYAITQ